MTTVVIINFNLINQINMKKTTFLMLFLTLSIMCYGQIAIIEDFEGGVPGDWTSTFAGSATEACDGSSVRDNIYQFSANGDLTSPNLIGLSNGTDLNLSFDYKIVDWSAATNPTPAGWGNFIVQYTTDGGTNWIDIDTIDDNNHVVSNVCATFNYTVLAADLPVGSDFQLRFNATWAAGDYYLYFDNVSAVQTADSEPSCDSVLTNPADGSTDNEINGNISWSVATGIPTGYFLTVGTTPGGNELVDNIDVGNVTSYALGQLLYETTYYVTITPYNAIGTTTDTCTEQSFTTKMDPSQTVDCSGAPLNITHCYDNNDDTFWLFTSSDGSPLRITFNAGGIESCCDDILIYDGVDNTGTLLYQGNNGGDLSGLQFDSVGTSLYVEIDADGSVSCASGSGCCSTEWDFTVACATCVNPVANSSVREDCLTGPQFFIDVDLTDLGSATSVTITDDQGSAPQTVSATGVYSFGPFANGTNVVTTVTNDDDGNCVVNSPVLTQDQCVLNLIDCTQPPTQFNYCYGNNDTTTWLFRSTDGSPVRITFNAGGIESCCDDILIYDGPDNTAPLIYQGNNGGDLSGLQFDSTGDEMFLEIDADGSVSCASGSGCCTTEWDFTVACATCVNPVATYDVVSDCASGPQFLVDVNLTDLGSATSVTITDDQGSAPQTVSATGTYTFGPFANTTDVVITVANDQDANCTLTSSPLTQPFCLDNVVDCTVGPINAFYCYGNNDSNVFEYTSTDGSPLNLVINSGIVEGAPFDFLVILDSDGVTELYNGEGNNGDISGLTFQSTGDTIFFSITSDGSVSCESGSPGEVDGIEYTVSCATCINPQATYVVVDDCASGDQFLVDVNIDSLGDASSVTITDNQGSTPVTVSATGTTQFGPYGFGIDVIFTVSNDQDVNCVINSSAIQLLACPPDNDNCPDAIVAGVNADSSCDIVTQGTLIEATDSGVPGGSCTGNPNDDVWFQFTALSEVQIIAINNLSGGFPNIDHAVYEGTDCNNLTELYCSDDDASVTPELTVGNTYFIRVFSGGSDPVTNDFELCIREAPSNIICENSVNFCSGADGLTSANIIGIPDTGQIACLFTAPNPTWNIIQIGQGGLIEIQIDQTDDQGNGLDVDFVLWGPFASLEDGCGNLDTGCPTPGDCPNNTSNPNFYPSGNIVDCSYSAAPTENLTIDNAQVGEVYILLVTNFNGSPGNITITQTNGGDPGDGVITAEIEATIDSNEVVFSDLDNDPTTPDEAVLCGFDQVTIFADSPFADTYIWYKDGFVLPGETSSSLTVTESDTYQVQAFDEECMDDAFSQIVSVKLYKEPSAEDIADVVICDGPEADGVEDFDLEALAASILGTQSDTEFTVRFYATEDDRNNATNALSSPYSSSGETIYVRVDDITAADDNFLGCRAITQFNLVVNPIPDANDPGDLSACDEDDGTGLFDLTAQDEFVNNSPDVTITYHTSPEDAASGNNALSSPYSSSGETIHVRVEDNISGCYNTTTFEIIVDTIPLAGFNTDVVDYQVCPNATAPISISLVPSNFTESEVTIQWYYEGGLISGESGISLPVINAGEYSAIITFNSGLQCDNEVFATVIELPFCEFPEGISPGEVDGLNDRFDLSSFNVVKLEIYNRNGRLVYERQNYTDEWYGQDKNGNDLPVGTYFYHVVYEGGAKQRTAWVYINR